MLPSHFILKMKILLLSETFVSLYQTMWIFNQDNHMNHYHSENLKLYINMFCNNISNSIPIIIFAEACQCTLLCST